MSDSAEIPATNEEPKQEAPKQFLPVCPYCGLDPCVPEMLNSTHGLLITRIFCCPNPACRKLFNVEAVGQRQPTIVGANGPVRLA